MAEVTNDSKSVLYRDFTQYTAVFWDKEKRFSDKNTLTLVVNYY